MGNQNNSKVSSQVGSHWERSTRPGQQKVKGRPRKLWIDDGNTSLKIGKNVKKFRKERRKHNLTDITPALRPKA